MTAISSVCQSRRMRLISSCPSSRYWPSAQYTAESFSPVWVLWKLSARSGLRSVIEVNSIIATRGDTHNVERTRAHYTPPLNNTTLFKRDANVCMYCGLRFSKSDLTRDHITPISRGGRDIWTNVVAACRRCNNHKGGRLPEEARMELLAVPFTPTYAEYIYLKGRRVLFDQMQYLLAHFPRTSPLHKRLRGDLDRLTQESSQTAAFAPIDAPAPLV